MITRRVLLLASSLLCGAAAAVVFDFRQDFGGIAGDASDTTCRYNQRLLTRVLQHNVSGNIIYFAVNETFYFHSGIVASNLQDATLLIDGTLRFERPQQPPSHRDAFADDTISSSTPPPPPCLLINDSRNVTISSTRSESSSSRGLIDGRGSQYWGVPFIGYLQLQKHRPKLVQINNTDNLRIENLILQDSPSHTLQLSAVHGAVVQNVSIVSRRTRAEGHGFVDLSAFNTDGIVVSGGSHNVLVRNVDIWNQDNCILVKAASAASFADDKGATTLTTSNLTFEGVNASGLGFTIMGSTGNSTVRNVTLRNCYLHRTVRGIQLKFQRTSGQLETIDQNNTQRGGLIQDIRLENVTMERPTQWPIWIGPQQRTDDPNDACSANPCSLCWPMTTSAQCSPAEQATFRNITFKNVRINNPRISPGVILADERSPIEGLVFDNVRVTRGRPLSNAQEDVAVSFPGLKQPINDAFVPKEVPRDDDNYDDDTADALPEPPEPQVQRNGLTAFGIWVVVLLVVLILSVASLLFWDFSREVHHRIRTRRVRFHESVVDNEKRDDEADQGADENESAQPAQPAQRELQPTRIYRSCRVTNYHLLGLLVFLCGVLSWTIRSYEGLVPEWVKSDKYFACHGVSGGVALGNTWPVPECFRQETPWWWVLARLIDGDSPYVLLLALALFSGTLLTVYFCVAKRQERVVIEPVALSEPLLSFPDDVDARTKGIPILGGLRDVDALLDSQPLRPSDEQARQEEPLEVADGSDVAR